MHVYVFICVFNAVIATLFGGNVAATSNNTANATSSTNTDAVVVAKLETVCSGINCPVELSNPVAILIAVVVGVVVSAT